MKTNLVSLGLVLMLLCFTPIIVATPTTPTIRVPTDLVTMNAVYGNDSYFEMTLLDVPIGYDISNGFYHGWCVQKTILMTRNVNHTVLLYSSYNQSLPIEYQKNYWDKINYILNHKQGNRDSIQKAIWHYTSNQNCSTDVNASAMIITANRYGAGFIPTPGQLIAIPVEGIPSIQLTFLETTIPIQQNIEGLVWDDTNHNGLQDIGEPRMSNIMIHLYQQDNLLINTTTTNSQGYYNFPGVTSGAYYLQFIHLTDYRFSPQNIGINDSIDSDVDNTGKTNVFIITLNQTSQKWDAGMYKNTQTPAESKNHRPTADGTAGEPYNGFVHETITFDGSRSYDRDGQVISWRWDFGDGTSGSGEITTHRFDHVGNYTVLLIVTDNEYASDLYTTTARISEGNNPPSPPEVTGPSFGHTHIMYEFIIVTTEPDSDTVRYIIDWGDENSDISPFFTSGHLFSATHLWKAYGFYNIRIYAQDQNNATSEITELMIAIDVHYVGTLGVLIDSNSDGIFDLFYSSSTSIETPVKILDNGDYLIDTNNDGDWDVLYNPTTHQYQEYKAIPMLEYILFILLIIAFLLIYQFIRIKRKTRILSSNRKK